MNDDTEQETGDILSAAQRIGLTLPDPCLPGVIANTRLLQTYIDLVLGFDLPDDCLPAYEYAP